MKIVSVFGTRPEAIKMAPVIRALEDHEGIESYVCVTGQHREMLDQVLDLFDIEPDFDLGVMARASGLGGITGEVLATLDPVLETLRPDRVLVHGDTTTTLAAALAAYYRKIPVGHVEAGLRTSDIYAPWPEEINRQLTGRIADLHFAPTRQAQANLLREGVAEDTIVLTGNTVIDALYWVAALTRHDPITRHALEREFDWLRHDRKLVLLTGHRRENFDGGLASVFHAVRQLVLEYDVDVVYPVHLNPIVRETACSILDGCDRVRLIPPLDYTRMVWLMQQAYFVITDSGGIQEEAPALGKPVLVTREVTERPEAVDAGIVKLVGTSGERILREARDLFDRPAHYAAMARGGSPYGDGHASKRIVSRLDPKPSHVRQQAHRGARNEVEPWAAPLHVHAVA